MKNYRPIDGLQRCTTIYEFISNLANFFNEEDIDDDSIKELKKLMGVTTNEETIKNNLIETILTWIKKEHKTMQEIIRMQYHNCAEMISKEFPTLKGKENQVVEIIKPMFSRYIEICETMSIDDNINLQDFDSIEIEKKSELTIFELIFGFGKLISEKFPHLFGNTKKMTEVNSVGFNLVNACFC